MFLTSIKNFILDILFPIYCLGCGREREWLCDDCQATFDISSFRYCLCQNPVPVFKEGKCSKCRSKKLDGLYFALAYQDARTRRLIQLFKYEPYIRGLARSLISLLISHFKLLAIGHPMSNRPPISPMGLIGPTGQISSILVPVPLHKKKLRQRGYNQSAEVAQELARFLNLPVIDDCLLKTKSTAAQVALPEKEREANIKAAFAIRNAGKIKNQRIFLVDDVYTTGSTMEECALVLKKAGAKEVWGVAIARG